MTATSTLAASSSTSIERTAMSQTTERFTLDFADRACQDVRQVGGKAASLAELADRELPVAPGFAVTAAAYRHFLDQEGLFAFTRDILDGLGEDADQAAFDAAEATISARMEEVGMPADVAETIRESYARLCETTGVPDIAVAVRSSATAEDSVDASFAGEFETWVDISGAEDVIAHVHKCYVSVFTGRVLAYLAKQGISPHEIEMAVVVQKTVRARAAGVMFTLSPTSGDRSQIVLEASWGLGLSVVGGEVTPDRYMVNKITFEMLRRESGHKHIEYRRGDAPQDVPAERQDVLCLSDDEVLALARHGKDLERLHGGAPQDIEFAIDEELPEGRNIILLQRRPETVWSRVERKPRFDAGAGMMNWITGSISGSAVAAPGGEVGHSH
jgi:pyruvate,water dikinase